MMAGGSPGGRWKNLAIHNWVTVLSALKHSLYVTSLMPLDAFKGFRLGGDHRVDPGHRNDTWNVLLKRGSMECGLGPTWPCHRQSVYFSTLLIWLVNSLYLQICICIELDWMYTTEELMQLGSALIHLQYIKSERQCIMWRNHGYCLQWERSTQSICEHVERKQWILFCLIDRLLNWFFTGDTGVKTLMISNYWTRNHILIRQSFMIIGLLSCQ